MTLDVDASDVRVGLHLTDATGCSVFIPGGHLRGGFDDGVAVHDINHSVAEIHTDAPVLDSVALQPCYGLSVDDPQSARVGNHGRYQLTSAELHACQLSDPQAVYPRWAPW
jgi:hypothetical protein